MMSEYPPGEEVTADRIQDEPWYDDFQSVLEVVCGEGGPYDLIENGLEKAIVACEKYYEECPGPPGWQPPSRERLAHWIQNIFDNAVGLQERLREWITPGALVQWVSHGQFVFAELQEVRDVVESEHGTYVFVKGSDTGIPIEQIVLKYEAGSWHK